LQQQTAMPFIITQQLHMPPASMLHKFCTMLQAILSSHTQLTFTPPWHFSNLSVQRGTINQLPLVGVPVGAPKVGVPIPGTPTPGIPIPVGAFDAHWDAVGAGCRSEDMVNVIGTSTCIIGITPSVNLVPGVCGVVAGSVHPKQTGIEAGLSAVGDIFSAIASRAGSDVQTLSRGLASYRPGQTGLLRMTWDNGDRTILVNPNLRGVTLGLNLQTTPQDELFAAIEGTAFHTRVIFDRMAEHGVAVKRVINAGGIPQKNDVLNQLYANILGRPVLVPSSSVTSLGSAIFAFLAAGTFATVEEAQDKICPSYRHFSPDPSAQAIYAQLYPLYRDLYFALGQPKPSALGRVLPELIRISELVNKGGAVSH